MTMPTKYATYEDIIVAVTKSIGTEEIVTHRVQGPEILMSHSKADLRMHYWAGVGLIMVFGLMFIAIVAMAAS